MNIADILILAILAAFALVGFKRGVLKSLVAFIGFVLIICLAYLFKDVLGNLFILNLPFFKFSIVKSGSVLLNIVMYQTIAFIIILILLGILYRILLAVTGIVEKILYIFEEL